ncbi:type IV secretory system conjugative DNA transfer family protein [Nocardiopsis sp. NPDC006938]|uniref:type IV secretory system conjugative DNA transfer family protein n=1 Tax=Nocardiopsis sp. NPDC006938 TaxID=3364337 RepID=UPI0036C04CFB
MSRVISQTPAAPGVPTMIIADSGEVPEIQPTMPGDVLSWPYVVAAVVVVGVVFAVAALVRRRLPGTRRKPVLTLSWRAKLRIHPGPGWVGGWARWRALGLPAARKVAVAARPSLSWWDRHTPFGWREYATHIGTTWGWVIRRRVVATSEDLVLTFAGPRRGKSAASAARIIDAPGKVLATSIRDDAVKHTIGPRSMKGSVFVMNPEGVGSYGSNLRYNPVSGCGDAQTAIRKAGYMVQGQSASGLSDADFWSDQASVALGGLLHAAALAGYSMDDVYAWALGTDDTPVRVLRQAKNANPAQRDDVANFLEAMPERTRGSVATTLRRTLQFMRDPAIAAMLSPRTDSTDEIGAPAWFDVQNFVTGGGQDTLYLISAGEDGVTAPLFAAVIAEIAYTVRHGSAQMPGGRLDPPLDMELDEIANVAPVPVHRWASWMGGCGVRIRVYAQSWSQLRDRFGQLADSLWACASMVVVYGGTKEVELLDRVRRLAGTVQVRGRDQVHNATNWSGARVKEKTPSYETMDVISASELRLPRHWAVVLSSDVAPALVSTPKAWKRRDVRRWRGRTPDCVVAPRERAIPVVDLGLRERVEQRQEQVQEQVQPLRVVATGTDGAVDPVDEQMTPTERAVRDYVRRTAATGSTDPQPQAAPKSRGRGRGRGGQTGPTPVPRSEPAPQHSGAEHLHPAPWDLPRSEPVNPTDDDLRGARMPWEEE